MEHLMDAIDRRLTELGLSPISGVVNNREQCTRYISRILEDHGILVHAIPCSELSRGRGGPRCMSMPLIREDLP